MRAAPSTPIPSIGLTGWGRRRGQNDHAQAHRSSRSTNAFLWPTVTADSATARVGPLAESAALAATQMLCATAVARTSSVTFASTQTAARGTRRPMRCGSTAASGTLSGSGASATVAPPFTVAGGSNRRGMHATGSTGWRVTRRASARFRSSALCRGASRRPAPCRGAWWRWERRPGLNQARARAASQSVHSDVGAAARVDARSGKSRDCRRHRVVSCASVAACDGDARTDDEMVARGGNTGDDTADASHLGAAELRECWVAGAAPHGAAPHVGARGWGAWQNGIRIRHAHGHGAHGSWGQLPAEARRAAPRGCVAARRNVPSGALPLA